MTIDPIANATIVHEKPPSGRYEEHLFGSDTGNTLWILFSDDYGLEEWIGKFGCGYSAAMRVTKALQPDKFMVVAGGFAYLIDATKKTLLNQYAEPFVSDIAYDPQNNHFIAADVRLRIIENSKQIWYSKRVSIDEIYGLKVEGRLLSGISISGYEGEEEPFSFDLDSREFKSGPDFSSCDEPIKEEKKPWWRFWK